MTSMVPEELVIELIDHEFDIVCEDVRIAGGVVVGGECDQPARWIFYRNGCCAYGLAHPSLFCDHHKDIRMDGCETQCLGCGKTGTTSEMYSHIEPLKQKS